MNLSMKRSANDYAWPDGMGSNKKPRWNPPSQWASYEPIVVPQEARPLRTASNVTPRGSKSSRRTAPSPKTANGEEHITPHSNDVLCGRGGHAIRHHGNIRFRMVVEHNKALYQTCKKERKVFVAQSVVEAIYRQDPPGRFLEQDKKTGIWNVIDKKKAVHKTSQALREGAKELRKKLNKEDTTSRHSSHDSDSDSRDNKYGDSDNENERHEQKTAYQQGPDNSKDFQPDDKNNSTQQNTQPPPQGAEYSNSLPNMAPSSNPEWIPDGFKQVETEASIVSEEELEDLFMSPSFLQPPVRETSLDKFISSPAFLQPPVRETSLDKFMASPAFLQPPVRETSLDKIDFWPLEEAQYLDSLLADEKSLIAA